MKRQEKADRIDAILEELYPEPTAPLLEDTSERDPYQLLVKVLLSAQCTDARVNEVAPHLFERAATAAEMAALPAKTIESIIRPCGLAPGKSKNIRALSRTIADDHGGEVPDDFAGLEALPGIGHKTASVVIAQAFHKPAFPVDTHIHRLAGRWGLSRARNVVEVERDLKKLFATDRWHEVHLQIIFFGRDRCPARYHDFESCAICGWATSKRRRAAERREWKAALEKARATREANKKKREQELC
jgi:endonuclease-3